MGVTDAPATERLPIRGSRLGRVLECKNVMNMGLSLRVASLGAGPPG